VALWPGMQCVNRANPASFTIRIAVSAVQELHHPFRSVDGHRECFINVTKSAVRLVG
jgi:hypothetical protein